MIEQYFLGRISCSVDEITGDLYAYAFSEQSSTSNAIWTNQFWKFCAESRKWECCGKLEMPDLTLPPPVLTPTKKKSLNKKNLKITEEPKANLDHPIPRRAAGFAFDSFHKVCY